MVGRKFPFWQLDATGARGRPHKDRPRAGDAGDGATWSPVCHAACLRFSWQQDMAVATLPGSESGSTSSA